MLSLTLVVPQKKQIATPFPDFYIVFGDKRFYHLHLWWTARMNREPHFPLLSTLNLATKTVVICLFGGIQEETDKHTLLLVPVFFDDTNNHSKISFITEILAEILWAE